MASNYWLSSQKKHWLFDQKKLSESNSKDKQLYTEEDVKRLRVYFSYYIQRIARQLNLRQRVAATSIVYWKRFYWRYNFIEFDPALVGATCVFLASKTEESMVRPESIVNECKALRDLSPFTYGAQDLVQTEYYVLQALESHLIIFHPYRSLPLYLSNANMQDFIEPAWKFVNDSYLTDVHLMHKPHTIALAAIYMAAFTVKDSDINKWFADLNVNLNEVGQVCNEILSVYELWNADFEKICRDMLAQIHSHLKKKK